MKVTEKVFTVELTETEVKIITNNLATVYKYHGKQADVRALRNAFASLLNITYMGEDA